ncbi:helix-turn-helix transcriptional regulator [Marinobacter adhaerens]|uniref:Helix-turn-helix transcriptional regulator n=1 Tax=Marinobacter adhaerens TaxID=1033846 RepID=A0A851HRB7_9GAMM|nr:helix-turn-helix transcriptional regulator [Marinobacter adhaerens]NWN92269.1 helix-turn-helix transcriptional regulator [Marinobacter adhaerens]
MSKTRKLSDEQIADARRLKKLWDERFEGVISQEEAAHRCGWKTQGAFNQYLNGRIPLGLSALLKISRALQIEPADISPTLAAEITSTGKAEFNLSESGYVPGSSNPPANELEFFGHMDAWDSKTPLDDDEVELPLFREVELAAGAGQTEVIENRGAKLRFAKSTLARAGVQKEHAACAFVRGNSMEPVMPDGTCVGVNTGDTAIRDGEIYAIDHGGMLRVKYLHRRPGGGLRIVSQNAGEYPVEDIDADQMAANVRVIGRVFWWSVLR